jgi:Tfp pilus assembly protein PilX
MNALKQPTRTNFECTSSISYRSDLRSLFVGQRPRRSSGSVALAITAAFKALRAPLMYRNERGMVTAVGLLMVAMLTLLGTTAAIVTSTDLLIGGNYKVSEGAFYAAEAGIEEARGRLRASAGTNMIADTLPTSSQWRAYIGTQTMAQAKGYNSTLSTNLRTDSLQSSMSYVVVIRHETDASGNVLYWGDPSGSGVNRRTTTNTGNNIYIVTSTGYTANSNRTVEAEVTPPLPISAPGAVYVKETTTVQGSSTYITGSDGNGGHGCGSQDRSGVATTRPADSVTINGDPSILGTGANPSIAFNQASLDIGAMITSLKSSANYTYTTSGTISGQDWGTPQGGGGTPPLPSSCSVHNVVYYNTSGTGISLTGQTSGCGILLVDGDLDLYGGFNWYGPILVTGSVTMTGNGGANEGKQITGAILAGGSASADLVGGGVSIIYCSSAISTQTQGFPLQILSWREP